MVNKRTIQWNCRGYSANYEEIRTLISEKQPYCLCLQETYHGTNTPAAPRGYTPISAAAVVPIIPGTRPSRGVVTLVRNNVPHYNIALNTTLEAVAVRLWMSRDYTICNIYPRSGEGVVGVGAIMCSHKMTSAMLLATYLSSHLGSLPLEWPGG